ncbi:MAG: amino acid--tRNA ligase-related protein, partial [Gammaproteobacteria bacterium]
MISWQPNNLSVIQERAALLSKIREFFKQENVLEVDTPLLCRYAGTAVHIDPFICKDPKDNLDYLLDNTLSEQVNNNLKFLQTSPEYAMKRLLAAGSSDIFQICKAFRANEIGKLHNPEFTMLEWYRLGFDHYKLMENVSNLLLFVLETKDTKYVVHKQSYRELFIKYLNCDPIVANLIDLKMLIINNINLSSDFLDDLDMQGCQELLFNHFVEPNFMGDNTIWFVYDYPKEQAALAKIVVDQNQDQVAERFEVYINGIELANG